MSERTVTHATFVVEREYAVPPARVFGAWADPQAKGRWFARTEGWETTAFELDFRVGGVELFRGRPTGGPQITYRASYIDIVDGQRIVFAYEMHTGAERMSVSLATVELSAAGAGTRLIFTEQGAFLDGHDVPEQREHGMGKLLDALGVEVDRAG